MEKVKTFDSSYFIGKSHFEENDTQNYLVFQSVYRYFKRITGVGCGDYIYYWKSNGLSDERTNSIKTPNHSITPNLDYYGTKTRVEFNGSCLKQDKVTFNHRKVNIYIVYELTGSSSNDNDPTVRNSLSGAFRLGINSGIDKYGNSGYGIGFDRRGSFSFPGGGFGQNVIIFGVDMSSSVHVDNKKGHFNSWKRSNARVRTYIDCRKNAFN